MQECKHWRVRSQTKACCPCYWPGEGGGGSAAQHAAAHVDLVPGRGGQRRRGGAEDGGTPGYRCNMAAVICHLSWCHAAHLQLTGSPPWSPCQSPGTRCSPRTWSENFLINLSFGGIYASTLVTHTSNTAKWLASCWPVYASCIQCHRVELDIGGAAARHLK